MTSVFTAAFYDAVRPIFGGQLTQDQVNGFEAIGEAWARFGTGNPFHLAYVLATPTHETGKTMQPLKETGNAKVPNPPDSLVKARLTKAWKAGRLPWVKKDYWSDGWFGRGFVQLTHEENYRKLGLVIGVDLVSSPDKAMIPEVAAEVLVVGMVNGMFTGKKLADYADGDFLHMRQIINGMESAEKVEAFAKLYLPAAKLAQSLTEARKTVPATPVPPKPTFPPTEADKGRGGLLAALVSFILSLLPKRPPK